MRAQFIYENINFQRGLDPKIAMGTGDVYTQAKHILQPCIDVLKELKQRYKKIKNIKFYSNDLNDEKFTNIKQFYVEFEYNKLYCSIGLDEYNDIIISLNDSKEFIGDIILDWIGEDRIPY
jgi:hypothetical protein